MNTIYKIFAKVLACRLNHHLPELVHDSQSGFVEERSILDNLITYWEACAIAKQTCQDIAKLMLDFEKAFDSQLVVRSKGCECYINLQETMY